MNHVITHLNLVYEHFCAMTLRGACLIYLEYEDDFPHATGTDTIRLQF